MSFRFCDLRSGDHIVMVYEPRLELVILKIDHDLRFMTHLCVVDEHRPKHVGTVYTTPNMAVNTWSAYGEGEILTNYVAGG